MKNKPKKPFVPVDRLETVRKEIMAAISVQPLSAKEISGVVRITEKAVFDHLQHIQKTINRKGMTFIITPSECKKCGFVFNKREKLKRPGRCPQCHGESITEPVFSIETES